MNSTLSVAVISGKGGVGKSNIALNLAYALNTMQHKVLLLDCDLGLASLDVLLGISTEETVENLLEGDVPASRVALQIDTHLSLIPAASGSYSLGDSEPALQSLFLERLNPFAAEFKYLFMDAGAGIGGSVQLFSAMAALRVVVVTPEPTSLTDGYAVMKVLASSYGIRDFFVLINQADSVKEGESAYLRLAASCEKFLSFRPLQLGIVRSDEQLTEAVRQQKPLLRYAPDAPAAKDLAAIAARIHKLHGEMARRLTPGIALRKPERRMGV